MIEGKDMSKESPTGRLRVAIIGPEKNGKSRLAATAPGNKLFLDWDQRREAVAGRNGVYAITLKDPGYPKMPEAAEEILDIMTGLEQSLDLSLLTAKGKKVFPDVPEGTRVDCIINDSMSSFAKCEQEYEMYNNPDLRRSIKIGPNMSVNLPKNFDAWNAEMKGVEAVVMRQFALPIHVICVFHEVAEEANDSTDEKPKYTGRVGIYPVRYKSLLKYFNEVWRVKLTPCPVGNAQRYIPRVYPLPDYTMDAATTMNLDPVEEPDIAAMIAKDKSRTSLSAVPTKPPQVAGISK